MSKHDHKTLVLNASYMPLDIQTSKNAFKIVCKGNAQVVAYHDAYFKTGDSGIVYLKPSIIRVRTNYTRAYVKVAFSKELMFDRDNWECVYCDCDDVNKLTVDHVIPESKGGPTTFENCVTACFKCNNEKSDLDLEEWGRPNPNPKRPHFLMMMRNHRGGVPPEWAPYLFM